MRPAHRGAPACPACCIIHSASCSTALASTQYVLIPMGSWAISSTQRGRLADVLVPLAFRTFWVYLEIVWYDHSSSGSLRLSRTLPSKFSRLLRSEHSCTSCNVLCNVLDRSLASSSPSDAFDASVSSLVGQTLKLVGSSGGFIEWLGWYWQLVWWVIDSHWVSTSLVCMVRLPQICSGFILHL